MIPSLWAGLCRWLLPGLPFLTGAPWPWDVMWLGTFWVHVWPDEHLDAVIFCIHLEACQFQWIYQGILIKSSVDLMHLDFGDLSAGGFAALAAWVGAVPVRLLSGWVVPTAQFTWTTANLSHVGRAKRAGPDVSAMYQHEWIMHGWALGVLGCQRMGPWRIPYRGIGDPL